MFPVLRRWDANGEALPRPLKLTIPAEAMADDEGALAQLGSGNHGADFLGAKLQVVVRSPGAVAHAGQINRRDAKIAGEVRRNVAPPVAMRTAAVNEKKATLARSRRLACPMQVVDPAPRYHHELRLPGWEMAHRNQSGAGARIVRRSAGTASLLTEAARALLDGSCR